jgi:glycosyltransferase involved in cell wall biosynthesis
MQPLVFIVVPVHNREELLETSIRSIQAQTYENWKLMIVDDNSTDRSPDVIARLKADDNRIESKVNTEFSHSCAGARLSGLAGRTGKYVAFLDSDDQWPIYHLAEFVEILENDSSIDYVFGDLQRVNEHGDVVTQSKFQDEIGLPRDIRISWEGTVGLLCNDGLLEIAIAERFNTGMQTSLFTKRFFDKVSLRDVYGCEDALLTLEAISNRCKIAVSSRKHLHYLVHSGNVSGANPGLTIDHAVRNCMADVDMLTIHVPAYVQLTTSSKNALNRRLADIYVWQLGNSVLRSAGQRNRAIRAVLRGIQLRPLEWRFWKTLLAITLGL